MEPNEALKRPQEVANGASAENQSMSGSDAEPAMKRVKLDNALSATPGAAETASRPRVKGVAPIKEE